MAWHSSSHYCTVLSAVAHRDTKVSRSMTNETIATTKSKARRNHPIEPSTAMTTTTTATCHPFVTAQQGGRKGHNFRKLLAKRHQKPKMAYRMAILASMAYWEFHKWALPENANGFRLHPSSSSKRERLRSNACQFLQQKKSFRRYLTQKLVVSRKLLYDATSFAVTDHYYEDTNNAFLGMFNSTFCQASNYSTTRACQFVKQKRSFRRYITRKLKSSKLLAKATASFSATETSNDHYYKDANNAFLGMINSTFCQEKDSGRTSSSLSSSSSKTKAKDSNRFTFQYWLYNWYEPGIPGVKFHDTDVLVSTSDDGSALVIAFGGTASVADTFTNIQTFEPANHSSFFMNPETQEAVQGSVHRGFLNAYTRVKRGSILSFSPNGTEPILESLHGRFGHCTGESKKKLKKKKAKQVKKKKEKTTRDAPKDPTSQEKSSSSDSCSASVVASNSGSTDLVVESDEESIAEDGNRTSQNKPNNVKERKSGGCQVHDERLLTILRQVVLDALESGRTVHLTGHSLGKFDLVVAFLFSPEKTCSLRNCAFNSVIEGGSLALLLALDVIVNFPSVPVSKLHLWTFGAPQISDDIFLDSVLKAAPRLQDFLQEYGNGRFHRYVTLSDDCRVDAVSDLARRTLATHESNLHGHAARKLGGVHGQVVHFAYPHYLLTPLQFDGPPTPPNATVRGSTSSQGENEAAAAKAHQSVTSTRSPMAAHSTINYLLGISRESKEHPLQTDLPLRVKEWLGGEDLGMHHQVGGGGR